MPTMSEIYANYALEYDELVEHEDYKGNLKSYLKNHFDFENKTVLEFGTGTGRLTKMYIDSVRSVRCCDRSPHMLERAKKKLSSYSNIAFSIIDNTDIEQVHNRADIVLEGWSFGHTVSDNDQNIEQIVEKLVFSCKGRLERGGTIIFIETLGTNTDLPDAPTETLGKFYQLLEEKYGFHKTVLETDYKFVSNDEATRVMGYFFGAEFGEKLKFSGQGIVKEYTGIWALSV